MLETIYLNAYFSKIVQSHRTYKRKQYITYSLARSTQHLPWFMILNDPIRLKRILSVPF